MKFKRVAFLVLAFIAFPFAAMASSPEYAEGEVIVLLKNGAKDVMKQSLKDGSARVFATAAAAKAGAKLEKVFNALSTQSGYLYALIKSDALTTEELVAELRKNPDVISVSPNYVYPAQKPLPPPKTHSQKISNDPYNPMWNLEKINAPAAWNVSVGDPGVSVAIADTGIDGAHEDLAPNIDAGLSKNFTINDESPLIDLNGHGTHVAGIMLAVGNNNLGIAGITWSTRAIALKIASSNGLSSMSSSVGAIEYILDLVGNGENIVALNFSFNSNVNGIDTPEEVRSPQNFNYPEWLAFKTLSDTNKVVIVVGAGNKGIEVGKPYQYPGGSQNHFSYPGSYLDIDNMIVVAAMDQSDSGSAWNEDSASPSGWNATNWSPTLVDIAAPGSEIMSARPDNQYRSYNGTSQATPHVTGAVALLASVAKKFGFSPRAQDYKRIILESSSKKIPELVLNGVNLGPVAAHGTLDLQAAVTQLLKEYVPGYDFTPVNITWNDGKAPALTAGEAFAATVKADRGFKNIAVILRSPDGTETRLEPKATGTLVEIAFTPPTAGDYALNFTATDAYDVEWDTSLPVSVKAAESGGGGGCSAFGAGFLVLVGIAALAKNKRPLIRRGDSFVNFLPKER